MKVYNYFLDSRIRENDNQIGLLKYNFKKTSRGKDKIIMCTLK